MQDTKENTARILTGKDPIQKLSCRLGFHRWTTWEFVPGNINRSTFDSTQDHVRCRCADCGLVRVEKPYSRSLKRERNK